MTEQEEAEIVEYNDDIEILKDYIGDVVMITTTAGTKLVGLIADYDENSVTVNRCGVAEGVHKWNPQVIIDKGSIYSMDQPTAYEYTNYMLQNRDVFDSVTVH